MPWEYSRGVISAGKNHRVASNDGAIAKLYIPPWAPLEVLRDVDTAGRLMAAAPELLEALERTLQCLSDYPRGGVVSACEQARVVIKKAKGIA